MKFPVDRPGDRFNHHSGRAVPIALSLIALALAAASTSAVIARPPAVPTDMPASGPAADYPMVLGQPYVAGGVTYTPADTMNIDQVGYAVTGSEGGAGISLAHRTLPLPCYVEVTSLKTGRTILVRAERRGPLSGDALIELSPGAAAQLGDGSGRTPVRMRRVNPPEVERALLRAGQPAPARMDTPMPLVGVLLRKLNPALVAPAITPVAAPAPVPTEAAKPVAQPAKAKPPVAPAKAPVAKPAMPVPAVKPAPAAPKAPVPPKPAVATKPAPKPAQAAHAGRYFVQVGTFSTAANAARAARQVGGSVAASGKFHSVRIGGFASTTDAQGALAKAKGAGYSDARILRAD